MFDVSQTEGEPLPKLDTAATGDASQLVPALLDVATKLAVDVEIVSPESWSHGTAKGICSHPSDGEERPCVEVSDRENRAALAVMLVHEFSHARLHVGVADGTERSKLEIEAEAIAAIVGRYFGLDTSGSAYYLAAWRGDDADGILDRLNRISSTAGELIDHLEQDAYAVVLPSNGCARIVLTLEEERGHRIVPAMICLSRFGGSSLNCL